MFYNLQEIISEITIFRLIFPRTKTLWTFHYPFDTKITFRLIFQKAKITLLEEIFINFISEKALQHLKQTEQFRQNILKIYKSPHKCNLECNTFDVDSVNPM